MAIFRDLPNPQVDNFASGGPSRAGRYGESYTLPVTGKEWGAADEGTYYVAVNPTAGTGIVGPVSTTLDEAKALLCVYNGGQNRIYPQRMNLWVTVVGTTGTRQDYNFTIDQGNRYSSGGTALTKSNVNMDSVRTTGATINFGALVTSAASGSRRLMGNHQIREAAIEIVGDQYTFIWGNNSNGGNSSGTRVATVADFQVEVQPMVIGPGQSLLLHHWRTSITVGVTFEVNFEYIER